MGAVLSKAFINAPLANGEGLAHAVLRGELGLDLVQGAFEASGVGHEDLTLLIKAHDQSFDPNIQKEFRILIAGWIRDNPEVSKQALAHLQSDWLVGSRRFAKTVDIIGVMKGESRELRAGLGRSAPLKVSNSILAQPAKKGVTNPIARRPMSEEDVKRVATIYSKHPELKTVLDKTPWSSEEKRDLLDRISEKVGVYVEAFYYLPVAIEKMKSTRWSSKQRYQLLSLLAEKAGAYAKEAFQFLPVAIEGMRKTGWSFEQQSQLLSLLAEKAGASVRSAFYYLPVAIEGMGKTGWSFEQQSQLLSLLAEKAGGSTEMVLKSADFLFFNTPSSQANRIKDLLLRLLNSLTDYNREGVLQLFRNRSTQELFWGLGRKHFLEHFDLYVEIFERWPRLGFAILEGLLEGEKTGLIEKDISQTRDTILRFIEKTHGFVPAVYAAYQREGETLLEKLGKYADQILKDELSSENVAKIIQENKAYGGEAFLLAVIQMASPMSGDSFVSRDQQIGLMKKMLEAGDLRGHIPKVWRGKLKTFVMEQGEWRIKQGQSLNEEAIKNLLGQFRVGEKKKEEKELIAALEEYLKSNRDEEAKTKARATLYAYAGSQDVLKEKIDRIQDTSYTTLLLLEQLFKDKDNLTEMIRKGLDKVPTELLEGRGKKKPLSQDVGQFVKALKHVWQSGHSESLSQMLRVYEEKDIEARILSRDDLEGGLKASIREAMQSSPALSKKEMATEILKKDLTLIKQEKAKFEYHKKDSIQIGLRAVKGPTYGMNGLSSGVCTATDIVLWKNPRFKLLSIIDEGAKQVVGYIHVFETVIKGKTYLTLPGINPSAEFLGMVEGQKLYDELMAKVIEFAKEGGYAGVYIPTNAIIHSNRSDIQKAIARKKYTTKQIPEVHWNTLPSPYPFSEVYVVWQAL